MARPSPRRRIVARRSKKIRRQVCIECGAPGAVRRPVAHGAPEAGFGSRGSSRSPDRRNREKPAGCPSPCTSLPKCSAAAAPPPRRTAARFRRRCDHPDRGWPEIAKILASAATGASVEHGRSDQDPTDWNGLSRGLGLRTTRGFAVDSPGRLAAATHIGPWLGPGPR